MKKIVLLLIMAVLFTGAVFAGDVAAPPGFLELEAQMSESSLDLQVVTPDTVLAAAPLSELAAYSFEEVMAHDVIIAMQPQSIRMFVNLGQPWTIPSTKPEFYLLC